MVLGFRGLGQLTFHHLVGAKLNISQDVTHEKTGR